MTELWRVPVAVTRVYLAIEADLPIEEMSELIGIQPSSSRRYENRLVGRELTEWKLELESGTNSIQVVDSACQRLLELGQGIAESVGGIVDGGGNAAFVIAQHVTGNPETTGIALSSEIVAWLASAHAWISIDQSVMKDDDWPV
jgi:hypothetical protein